MKDNAIYYHSGQAECGGHQDSGGILWSPKQEWSMGGGSTCCQQPQFWMCQKH